jgi:hypothetical protein
MNTSEISAKNGPRLHRIEVVSRFAKWMCFVFLTYLIGMSLFMFFSVLGSQKVQADWRDAISLCFHIVLWLWYWNLARLFGFYERGQIFYAATIRCIKMLGLMFVAGWVLMTVLHFFPIQRQMLLPELPPTASSTHDGSGTTIQIERSVRVTTHAFRMGFFTFDFGTGIDFGLLLGGAVIVLVAWIMDEGRKLQEEQELTV